MKYLFTPDAMGKLSYQKMRHLLKPQLSAEGSNRRAEQAVWKTFLKYLKEVAGKLLQCYSLCLKHGGGSQIHLY